MHRAPLVPATIAWRLSLSLPAVRLEEPASTTARMGALGKLKLDVTVPWPLTLVVQDAHLRQYNAIFAILLQVPPLLLAALLASPKVLLPSLIFKQCCSVQVHMAGMALSEVHSSICRDKNRRSRGMNTAGALAMSMHHFLGTYLSHVMGHLVHTCASSLQQVCGHRLSLCTRPRYCLCAF